MSNSLCAGDVETDLASDSVQELLRASAAAWVRGDVSVFGPGVHAYAELCKTFDVKSHGGPWAVLAAWRLGDGESPAIADVKQLYSELQVMEDPLFTFAQCAGMTAVDCLDWPYAILQAIGEGKGDLTAAAQICSDICRTLTEGATRLLATEVDLSEEDNVKVTFLRNMFSARSAAYLAGPMTDGRYLPDELLLFDLRAEWVESSR